MAGAERGTSASRASGDCANDSSVRDPVLLDTGPLVALFDPSDRDRQRCREALRSIGSTTLLTSEAVVTEAMYLLDFSVRAQAALQEFLLAAQIRVEAVLPEERGALSADMSKYVRLPMDYADATLVALARRFGTTRVFTLDRKDFSVYRCGRKAFRLLPD